MASEGLLLIRIEADDRGRYGFNVKVSHLYYVYTCSVKKKKKKKISLLGDSELRSF